MRLDDKIDFNAILVAHVIDSRLLATIELRLKSLHDNQILKQTADQRISHCLLRRFDLQKMRGKTDISEIDLG